MDEQAAEHVVGNRAYRPLSVLEGEEREASVRLQSERGTESYLQAHL